MQIKTHKLIISSCSPVLRNILKSNQSTDQVIYLRRVKYRDLQNIINFMYQGEANIAEENLSSFLELAEDLNVRGLCESNTENLRTNGKSTSEDTYQSMGTSTKIKTTKIESTENITDDCRFPKNDIDANTLIYPKGIKTEALSQEYAKPNQQNGTTTVAIRE